MQLRFFISLTAQCSHIPDGYGAKQRARRQPASQAHSLHPPHTEEQTPTFVPKSSQESRSICRRSMAQLRCTAKRKAAAFVRQAAAPASAGQTGTQFAPASHQIADTNVRTKEQPTSSLDWSEIPDGCGAKQRGRRHAAAFVGKQQLLRWL